MGKILIIGVGETAANTVRRMKEVGITNAEYITFSGY
jgi:cell division GTPase FtsZ